jgi:uncharacterized protein (DUF58 family)
MAATKSRFGFLAGLVPMGSILARGAAGAKRARRTPGPSALDQSQSLLDEGFVHRLERLNALTRGRVSQGVAGEHRSRRYASSAEFADFRNYVPGDDFRRIDWNAYARLGGLFLKLTEAKEDVAVHILVDSSQSMNWGHPNKLIFARQVAAALGYVALSRFDAVTGASFAETLIEPIPKLRGKNQALRFLQYLDHATVGATTRLDYAMAQYCGGVTSRGLAFVISDLLTEDDWQKGLVRLIGEGMDVVVIHVLAPEEISPSADGEIELIDAETGDIVELVVGEEARRSYAARVEQWCREIEDFCHRSAVRYLRLDSAMEIEQIFLDQMRRRRIVR